MEKQLQQIIEAIRPADGTAMEAARARQERLAKPPRSLGQLETLGIRMAGITGQVHNQVKKRAFLGARIQYGISRNLHPRSCAA